MGIFMRWNSGRGFHLSLCRAIFIGIITKRTSLSRGKMAAELGSPCLEQLATTPLGVAAAAHQIPGSPQRATLGYVARTPLAFQSGTPGSKALSPSKVSSFGFRHFILPDSICRGHDFR
jgi:hypothetical protein